MIHRGIYILTLDDETRVVCGIRAKAPCGCSIFLGRREDTEEISTVSRACAESHQGLIERAHARHKRDAEDPSYAEWSVVEQIDVVLNDEYHKEFAQ